MSGRHVRVPARGLEGAGRPPGARGGGLPRRAGGADRRPFRRGPSRRELLLGAAASPLLALGPAGCGRVGASGSAAPGILVVAIDGLRADHAGCYGYDRDTTPTVDRLAAEGVRFASAFSSSPVLLPAHVSLLTGCEPWVARRNLPAGYGVATPRRWRVPPSVPHLAVELLVREWSTAAFVDDPDLAPVYGFRPGFQVFASSESDVDAGVEPLAKRLLQFVHGVGRDRPWFAYLHLHDLERSWRQPDPAWERFFYPPRPELSDVPPVGLTDDVLFAIPVSRWRGGALSLGAYEASYDGHVRRTDAGLSALFDGLRRVGRFEDTTIAVTGAYGLELGEAGLYLCAGRYAVADLQVPLIVRPRAGLLPDARRGSVVEHVTSTTDLAPTLLALEGIDAPHGTHGTAQVRGMLEADAPPAREYAYASCGVQEGCALFGERYVLEYLLPGEAENPELLRSWFGEVPQQSKDVEARFYDRLVHPNPPLGPLRDGPKEVFERYRKAAAGWIATMDLVRRALHGNTIFRDALDEKTLRELRRRGYLPD